MKALDPIHAEAAARELALAQRLSAGEVYSTAREVGTKAVVLMCKAMGLTTDEVHIVETWCISADAEAEPTEAERAEAYEERYMERLAGIEESTAIRDLEGRG